MTYLDVATVCVVALVLFIGARDAYLEWRQRRTMMLMAQALVPALRPPPASWFSVRRPNCGDRSHG